MILVTFDRTRGNEPPFNPIKSVRKVDDAFSSLVEFELGYGGQIIDMTPLKVTVRTCVLGCVDTTSFQGSAEDMALLLEVAGFVLYATDRSTEHGEKLFQAGLDNVMQVTQGNPLMVKLGGDMLMSQPSTKIALVACCQTADEATVKRLLKLTTKDLCALVCLVRRDGASLEDALDLAEATPVYSPQGKIAGLTQTSH